MRHVRQLCDFLLSVNWCLFGRILPNRFRLAYLICFRQLCNFLQSVNWFCFGRILPKQNPALSTCLICFRPSCDFLFCVDLVFGRILTRTSMLIAFESTLFCFSSILDKQNPALPVYLIHVRQLCDFFVCCNWVRFSRMLENRFPVSTRCYLICFRPSFAISLSVPMCFCSPAFWRTDSGLRT